MIVKNALPPLSSEEADGVIDRAINIGSQRERNITEELRQWIEVSNGHFLVRNSQKELEVVRKQDRHAFNVAINYLCKQGLIEKYGSERGVYRKVENTIQEMDWETCDDDIVDVRWPFGLEKYYLCLPKNIVVIAGSYDAGKTAFCLNFAMLNMDKYPIKYFSSEMGALELKVRLKKFGISFSKWKAVQFIERSTTFSDVIDPDGINIVDYIEVPEEAWKIATPISEIFRKLNKGICVIALQKPKMRDIARGGEATLDRPRLYLSIGNGIMKIIKCKNWANESINPNGLSLEYKILSGCNFLQQSEWSISYDEFRGK